MTRPGHDESQDEQEHSGQGNASSIWDICWYTVIVCSLMHCQRWSEVLLKLVSVYIDGVYFLRHFTSCNDYKILCCCFSSWYWVHTLLVCSLMHCQRGSEGLLNWCLYISVVYTFDDKFYQLQ